MGIVRRSANNAVAAIIVITVKLFLFCLCLTTVSFVKNRKIRRKIKFRITLRIGDFFEGFFRVKYGG